MPVVQDEHSRTCIVMMPYGKKEVDGVPVDFDAIYKKIFKPAIQNVKVNGSTRLKAHRCDEAAHSRLVRHTMFWNIKQSRLALADMTGANPNVVAELTTRLWWRETGTVVVQMPGPEIPFNFRDVALTYYQHRPPKEAKASVAKISRALRETLRHNEVDSPFYEARQVLMGAMGPPERPTKFGRAVVAAEEAALKGDPLRASRMYQEAAKLQPHLGLLHQRRGALLLQGGRAVQAKQAFRKAEVVSLANKTRMSALGARPEKEMSKPELRWTMKDLELAGRPALDKVIKNLTAKSKDRSEVAIPSLLRVGRYEVAGGVKQPKEGAVKLNLKPGGFRVGRGGFGGRGGGFKAGF